MNECCSDKSKGKSNSGTPCCAGAAAETATFTDALVVRHTTSAWKFADTLGTWKARWGLGRMRYIVYPGLYSLGAPNATSPVLVTANYKISFDVLRKSLNGVNAWILVLDTKGINVWCAAGKGTFGTEEILRRIEATRLSEVVSHRTLVLPQLGAPGVSAHEIAKNSGFRVVYGPVRAQDVKAFLDAGMKASPEMRRVKFTTYDRLVLTPVEVVGSLIPLIATLILGLALNYFNILRLGSVDLIALVASFFAGAVLTPTLLPWVPGKAFAFKGWFVGLLVTLIVIIVFETGIWRGLEFVLILPMISAFIAMNFTGASTYTSPTGVLKEMKIALPIIIFSALAGIVLLVVERIFFN